MENKKILIVEDEQFIASDIKMSLDEFNYNVMGIIAKGEEVLEFLNSNLPDLILMDINLAGQLDGIETANIIKAKYNIPIIYLTAFSDKEILAKAKESVPYGYIVKPFNSREITSSIEMALFHHKIKKKIAAHEARYKMVVQDQTEYINRFLEDGTLTFVNDAYCKYKRSDYGKLINTNWMDDLLPNDKKNMQDLLKLLTPQKPSISRTYKTKITQNQTKWTEWSYRAIYSEIGEFIEYQSIGRDISKRKQAEEEKNEVQRQLIQSQKMEIIGRLVGGIAHDFNNLLTAINGSTEIVLSKINKTDEIYDSLNVIKECGDKAVILIKQLLGFSRKHVAEKKVIDIESLILNLEDMLIRIIGSKYKINFLTHLNICKVNADPNQIEQALINLVVNARDAMPNGGTITIEIQLEKIHKDDITFSNFETSANKAVKISVIDTGIGIDKETQKQIFEPFFTTKAVDKGTGLGLSTVYSIVEKNNGIITLESTIGKGSKFHIFLPYVEQELENNAEQESENAEQKPHGNETVMIVEDEDSIREMIESILQEFGYKTIIAEDGEIGFSIIENYKEPIHLLLTDVNMPKMSGYTLAQKIQRTKPEIKVIFMSGYIKDDELFNKVTNTKRIFIKKPFTFDSLISKVRSVLDS